jgi:hypothetical protein
MATMAEVLNQMAKGSKADLNGTLNEAVFRHEPIGLILRRESVKPMSRLRRLRNWLHDGAEWLWCWIGRKAGFIYETGWDD